MYTNIDTTTCLQALNNWFEQYKNLIPKEFLRLLFLRTLEIAMNNNIFTFSNTFWLQLKGTAIDNPAAPLYSILTHGFHENSQILPTFKQNLLYYKRYIDVIFWIWVDSDNQTREGFKCCLSQFGSLCWNIEDLTLSTNFLDLKISIVNSKKQTTTCQKELNLYLYIPTTSAHPTNCFKGLIAGEIIRYWTQNTFYQDYWTVYPRPGTAWTLT
jgi:hypothetical protein